MFCPRGGGQIILFVTRIKQKSSEQYNDYISGEYLFWEGEKGQKNDARNCRSPNSGEQVHLFYREIHHSAFEYKGVVTVTSIYTVPGRSTKMVFHLMHDQSAQDDLTTHRAEIDKLPATERDSVIKARVGQGTFRHSKLVAHDALEPFQLRRSEHASTFRTSSLLTEGKHSWNSSNE